MEEINNVSAEESDEVLFEETEDDTPLEISPDKRRVKTDKRDTPLETIHGWVKRGKLDLQPDFQRYFVWNNAKASRLIESLLLDIPIPVIYLAEDDNQKYVVVDGQQRLTSLCSYVDGKFPDGKSFKLSSLPVLKELNGQIFKKLEETQQEKIFDSSIRLIIIEKDSDPAVKYEVFERLNVGAQTLKDQELRNCVYRGNYNDMLKDIAAKNKHLQKILGLSEPHKRMADCQLILRFFAMWRNTHLKYKPSMKQFLNREMEMHRNLTDYEKTNMRAVFEKSIEMAYLVFGDNAFRRFNVGNENNPDGYWETRKFNIALWDTILYTFSFYEKSQIVPVSDAIREEFLDLLTYDSTFIDYISRTTDKAERVQYRADTWRNRIQNLIGYSGKEPRNFSLELKERLFKANPTCQICKQRIHDVDDSELDHIQHYWRGGKTIDENARLTHRYCNRARGGN